MEDERSSEESERERVRPVINLMPAKILLADDSITIQKIVQQTFKSEDVALTTVSNGEAAIRHLKESRPDLILADIFMPGKDGYQVCGFVKQDLELSSIPVILLVGAFDPFDEKEASRVQADGHLKKPFAPRMLMETVQKYLSLKKSGAVAAKTSPKENMESTEAPYPATPTQWHAEVTQKIPLAPRAEDLPTVASNVQNPPAEPRGLSPFEEKTEPRWNDRFSREVTSQFDSPSFELETPLEISHLNEPAVETQRLEQPIIEGESEEGAPLGHINLAGAETSPLVELQAGHELSVGSPSTQTGFVSPASEPPAFTPEQSSDADVSPQEPVRREFFGPASARESEEFQPELAHRTESESVPSTGEATERGQVASTMEELIGTVPPSIHEAGSSKSLSKGDGDTDASSASVLASSGLSEEVIDAIVRRVVEKMTPNVVEEVAWEVVPEIAEFLLKKKITEKN